MTAAENEEYRRLEGIQNSDFEMADGHPRIIGWEIKDVMGQRLGEVFDLLFNPQAMKVRYLVAKLDAEPYFQESKIVLIPIGLAELHESADLVFVPAVTVTQLLAAPVYDPQNFSYEQENLVLEVYRDDKYPGFEAIDQERRYEHQIYNHLHLYQKRNKLS